MARSSHARENDTPPKDKKYKPSKDKKKKKDDKKSRSSSRTSSKAQGTAMVSESILAHWNNETTSRSSAARKEANSTKEKGQGKRPRKSESPVYAIDTLTILPMHYSMFESQRAPSVAATSQLSSKDSLTWSIVQRAGQPTISLSPDMTSREFEPWLSKHLGPAHDSVLEHDPRDEQEQQKISPYVVLSKVYGRFEAILDEQPDGHTLQRASASALQKKAHNTSITVFLALRFNMPDGFIPTKLREDYGDLDEEDSGDEVKTRTQSGASKRQRKASPVRGRMSKRVKDDCSSEAEAISSNESSGDEGGKSTGDNGVIVISDTEPTPSPRRTRSSTQLASHPSSSSALPASIPAPAPISVFAFDLDGPDSPPKPIRR